MSDNNDDQTKRNSTNRPKLITPYDLYFRTSFAQRKVRVEFCQVYLPRKLSKSIDYRTVNLSDTSYIDETLQQYASDLVFDCQLKGNRKNYKVAVLIEHQSTPDKSMAVRVHHYMMSIFTKELKQQSKHKKLTPVYPVIFYNGIKSPYPYSLDIFENFDDPLNIMPDVLAKPIPLIDINLLDDDKLRKQNLLGIVTRAIKYRDEMQWTKQSLIELVDDLILILSHTKPNEFREIFRPLVTYLTNIVGEQKLAQAIVENEKLPKNVKGEFMTAYEFYLQKGKNIGIEQGKNIGIEQGKNIGIEQGEAIGFEKGEYQKSIEIAKTALRKDFDIQTVAELTELDVKTIQMLVEQLKDEK